MAFGGSRNGTTSTQWQLPRHVAATPLAEVFADAPTAVRQAIAGRVTDALSSYVQGPGFRVPFTPHLLTPLDRCRRSGVEAP
jgi:hypothetical protein